MNESLQNDTIDGLQHNSKISENGLITNQYQKDLNNATVEVLFNDSIDEPEKNKLEKKYKICKQCGEKKERIHFYVYRYSMSGVCKRCSIEKRNAKKMTKNFKMYKLVKQIYESEPHILVKYGYDFIKEHP